LLNGKHAGHKAVIVKTFDEGDKSSDKKHYGHALVAGVAHYPRRVTKDMTKKQLAKRSRVKPFLKMVNYNHAMPTRYGLDIDLKNIVTPEAVYGEKANRKTVRGKVKKLFEERYQSGKNRWFFTKLRF